MNWLKKLFTKKFPKKKRKYTLLSKFDVKRLEDNIDQYNRQTMMEYYNISASTYYSVKNKTHRYSTK